MIIGDTDDREYYVEYVVFAVRLGLRESDAETSRAY